MLRAGQFARAMEARAQERELMGTYTQSNLFAHSLLYTLYKLWLSHCREEAGSYLALPGEAEVDELMSGLMQGPQGGPGQNLRA